MTLIARSRVKVGARTYWPGDVIDPQHEAELRSRPTFSVSKENGRIVEVKSEDPSPSIAPVPDPPSEPPTDPKETGGTEPDPTATPVDRGAGGVSGEDGFPCPYCDYVAKKEVGLKVHIGRDHKDKLPKQGRRRRR